MSSASADSGGTELALAARPFAYELGYGDFCFLRLVDRYPKPLTGGFDPEFIRLGTFPFMRLPRELRDKIYEYVLAPLLSKHAFLKGDRRHLVLRISHTEDKHYKLKFRKAGWVLDLHSKRMKPEVIKTIEEERQKVDDNCKRFFHPTRAEYEITFPVDYENYYSTEKIPPGLIACIRNFSNVSGQIREEFAMRAWSSSLLEIDYDYVSGLACLEERPAIWKGIKAMLISFRDLGNDMFKCLFECPSGKHECSEGFLSLIEFMDQHLQLDVLMFKLDMYSEHIDKVLESTVKPKWVDALRSLRCAKDIQFQIRVIEGWDDERDYDEDEMDAQAEELEDLLMPSILTGSDEKLSDKRFPTTKSLGWTDRLQLDGSFARVIEPTFNNREFLFDEYSWCNSAVSPPPRPDSSDDDVDGDVDGDDELD